MSLPPANIMDRLLDPVARCFTPEGAERLLEVELDASVRQRLDDLAAKSSAGTLTEAEQSEFEGCVDLIDFIGVLQAKVGALLGDAPPVPPASAE
jgi:hypothetical protein